LAKFWELQVSKLKGREHFIPLLVQCTCTCPNGFGCHSGYKISCIGSKEPPPYPQNGEVFSYNSSERWGGPYMF